MTRGRLFSDSGGFCQNPECLRPLFKSTATQEIQIAEIAHIIASSDAGARANPSLDREARAHHSNLILLCPSCHTIIDKAEPDYPADTLRAWKAGHRARIDEAFSARKYVTRREAREAIARLLAQNRTIHREYGPDSDERFNPESSVAPIWRRKAVERIIPNNLALLRILDVNHDLLTAGERETVELFRQHVDDLIARHLGDGSQTAGARFPTQMDRILEGHFDDE